MKCGTTNGSHWLAQAPGARGGPLVGQNGGYVTSAGIARSGVTVELLLCDVIPIQTVLKYRTGESQRITHFSIWPRFQLKADVIFALLWV
jgi:hypothetical protein